ncbi:cellulase family glycosylhydrolase [Rufibacter roseus]|uniref:Cellulase family glycosylhydrolase n=1 Tax=Rufibacter roseus TaxID=1567108 RepID=A0ABW2DS34_9BACT|nr:cellulase family glycosylhydrolase [Rufibacter roseus]
MPALQLNQKPAIFWHLLFIWLVLPFTATPLFAQEVPFNKGVNLTNWFQANEVRQIHFTKYTKKDFENIKSLGADVIRLPINLHAFTRGAPEHVIDPLLFTFLDEAVNWAEDLDLHLILDNHSFDPIVSTRPEVEQILEKVWAQMAQHYKDRSDRIYYEILNEPHGISDAQWNAIQGRIIEVIRKQDTKHYIIVGASNYNSYHNLAQLPVYHYPKLIYTFHFYDPFLFTHQGASWVEPSLVPLANMPFPYRVQDMPALPNSLRGTWMENAYNNYQQDGTVAKVKQLIDIAAHFKETRNVPVFCGEFGVFQPNSRSEDRVFWYQTVRTYLEQKGIAWTSWDYHHEFGLFKQNGANFFEQDLNTPLLQALGFNIPPQAPYVKQPLTKGFAIYSDYLGQNIVNASYGTGSYDFYADQKPNNGRYSLSWTNAAQYNSLSFNFQPDIDLSLLRQNGFALDFIFRATSPSTSFDIRFIDTKTTDPDDHPWRAGLTLNEQIVPFDGRWHHVRLPLTSFYEQGSWDNAWFAPDGKFDWTNIDRLEITAEQGPLGQTKLWFDNIYVSDQDTAKIYEHSVYDGKVTGIFTPNEKEEIKVYPNPAAEIITINVTSPGTTMVDLINNLGVSVQQATFQSRVQLSTSTLPSGVYVVQVTNSKGQRTMNKVVILH